MSDEPDFKSLKSPVTKETHAWADREAEKLAAMTPEERAETIATGKLLSDTLADIRKMRKG